MAAHRVLRLSYHHGLLCGVCGGLAEWLGWKPRVVRILYTLVSILSAAFPGILIYFLLYLIMPGPELANPKSARRAS